MAQFRAIYLENNYEFLENDSADLTFVVYDSDNQLVEDLSPYKFYFLMDNGALELEKKDANYSDGSNSQISVLGHKITVHIEEEDTNNFEDDWWLTILRMTNKTTSNRYTIFKKKINIYKEPD